MKANSVASATSHRVSPQHLAHHFIKGLVFTCCWANSCWKRTSACLSKRAVAWQSATGMRTGSLMNVTLFHSSPQDALQRSTFQPSAHVRMPVSMPAMVAAKHVRTKSGQMPGLMLLPDRTSKLGQQLGTTCVTENAIER